MNRYLITAMVVSLTPFVAASPLLAQTKKPAEERREAERIRSARKAVSVTEEELSAARQSLQSANKSLTEAQQQREKAIATLREARQRAESRLEEKLGIAAAVARHQEAEKTFRELSQPILAQLKETPAYQTAVKDAEKARAELQQQSTSSGKTTDTADEARLALLAITLKPVELEKQALNASKEVVEARRAMLDQQTRAAALRAELQSGVDGDSQVRAAQTSADALEDKVEAREGEVARRQAELGRVQEKLARARQAVQNAIQADRKDDQKDRRQSRDSKKPKSNKK